MIIETDEFQFESAGLPDTLHGLLETALNDLEQVRKNPLVKISMNDWVTRTGFNSCSVCLAGAALLRTGALRWRNSLVDTQDRHVNPDLLHPSVGLKLEAINHLRMGDVYRAANGLGCLTQWKRSGLPDNYVIANYQISPAEFVADLRNLVLILKEHNL